MGTGGTPSLWSPEMVSPDAAPRSASLGTFRFTFRFRGFRCYIFRTCVLTTAHPVIFLTFFVGFFQLISLRICNMKSSCRPISIIKLTHCCAFTDDLSTWSSFRGLTFRWSLLLEVGFTLRCLQRLSLPHFASQLCRWHDNCCTRDASTPVLSYWEQLLSWFLRPRWIGTELSHDVLNPARVPL